MTDEAFVRAETRPDDSAWLLAGAVRTFPLRVGPRSCEVCPDRLDAGAVVAGIKLGEQWRFWHPACFQGLPALLRP